MIRFLRSLCLAGSLWALCHVAATAQPMNDGEACLSGSGQAMLDEAFCRAALNRSDLAAIERSALLTSRASALLRLGEPAEAMAEVDRALTLNPASAQAHLLRGLMRQKPRDARSDFDRAVALNPQFTEAYAYRGVARLQEGDLAGAMADFDHALEIRPGSSLALFHKGVVHFQQGRFDLADDTFRRVLNLSPVQHPMAALWLAATVGRMGGDGGAVLQPYLWWWEDGVWPAPLARLWSGTATPQQVVEAMADMASDIQAQGAFFLAQWHLAHRNAAAARTWLDRVRRQGEAHMLEVIVSKPPPSQ